MAQKTSNTIHYQINRIEELEIHVPFLPDEITDHFDRDRLDFGFSFDYVWDLEENLFSVVIEVVYLYVLDNEQEELLRFSGQIEYKITDLVKFIDIRQKEIKLPEEILGILTGIAISTIRGMIATRTFGKFQGDLYIPILNPMKVVNQYLKNNASEEEVINQ
ncbi:MAG TPA: hypothetical protein PKA00_10830 [Saprospiraceae bacterium]|nr:hypothetical protein [Saprospiraceae bacterium]HMQ83396.1 hypothetical protein [Saprospiraceae bacterium]